MSDCRKTLVPVFPVCLGPLSKPGDAPTCSRERKRAKLVCGLRVPFDYTNEIGSGAGQLQADFEFGALHLWIRLRFPPEG